MAATRSGWLSWTLLVPLLAVLTLVLTWGRKPGAVVVAVVALVLGAAVLAAVHHAEVVATGLVSRTARWFSPSR